MKQLTRKIVLSFPGESYLTSTSCPNRHSLNHAELAWTADYIASNGELQLNYNKEDIISCVSLREYEDITDNWHHLEANSDILWLVNRKVLWIGCPAHCIDFICDDWQTYVELGNRFLLRNPTVYDVDGERKGFGQMKFCCVATASTEV